MRGLIYFAMIVFMTCWAGNAQACNQQILQHQQFVQPVYAQQFVAPIQQVYAQPIIQRQVVRQRVVQQQAFAYPQQIQQIQQVVVPSRSVQRIRVKPVRSRSVTRQVIR